MVKKLRKPILLTIPCLELLLKIHEIILRKAYGELFCEINLNLGK